MLWCTSHVGLRLTASTGQGPEVVKQNGFFWHLATRNGPCVGSSEVRITYTWYCMYIIYMSLKHCWYNTIKREICTTITTSYIYTNIPQHPSMGGHRLRLSFVFSGRDAPEPSRQRLPPEPVSAVRPDGEAQAASDMMIRPLGCSFFLHRGKTLIGIRDPSLGKGSTSSFCPAIFLMSRRQVGGIDESRLLYQPLSAGDKRQLKEVPNSTSRGIPHGTFAYKGKSHHDFPVPRFTKLDTWELHITAVVWRMKCLPWDERSHTFGASNGWRLG